MYVPMHKGRLDIVSIKEAIKNPYRIIGALISKDTWINHAISDEVYLKIMYHAVFGYQLDLHDPKTFNEKLQWLKLHDRNPEYSNMVDKYEVKRYIASKIGDKYIIPTYGVWDDFKDIDFDLLPNSFVLKCTHDSGGVVVCKDKTKLDLNAVKNKICKGMKTNYYYRCREWPYKNVKPRIIAEQYLCDCEGEGINDYKVLCFGGEPKLIELHMGRFTNHQTQDIYDVQWNKTSMSQTGIPGYKVSNICSDKPENLDEMLELSRVLSNDLIHVRVDWYLVSGKLFFGELTFFDGSGFEPWDNPNDDYLMGSWMDLSKCKEYDV